MVTSRTGIGSKGGMEWKLMGIVVKNQKRISNCKGNCSGGSSLKAVNEK